jgi:hypothetical protein
LAGQNKLTTKGNMPIIDPSRSFENSAVNFSDEEYYIKSDVRTVSFKKNAYPDGVYLLFLPGYKTDRNGNGVWYRVINVRDNFGDKFKIKYVTDDVVDDPVLHFSRNFSRLYPEQAKSYVTTTQDGTQRRVYPLYGRLTRRVLYNVAFYNAFEKGAHVLDLPAANGADILDNYHQRLGPDGKKVPLVCDIQRCTPVFFKLLNTKGSTPWQIVPEPNYACALPPQCADTNNLYNLDQVTIIKDKNELLERLRELYSASIFSQCMEGYPGFPTSTPGFSPGQSSAPIPAPPGNPSSTPGFPLPTAAAVGPSAGLPAPTLPPPSLLTGNSVVNFPAPAPAMSNIPMPPPPSPTHLSPGGFSQEGPGPIPSPGQLQAPAVSGPTSKEEMERFLRS